MAARRFPHGLWAPLGIALAVAILGCSTNSNEARGGALGESCARTADCQSGLVCVSNTCLGMGRAIGGAPLDATAETASSGGGVDAGTPEGAAVANGGPNLATIGESCQTTRDCASGLACVPTAGGASVCDVVSYGVTAGTKTCTGECSAATDCCALPVGLSLSGRNDAGVYVAVNNCADVLSVLLGGDPTICANASASSAAASGCFFYQTYCSCAANTWACTAGRCVYTASCQGTSANTLGGCPSFTRTRTILNTTCDMPGNKCRSAASGCSTDTDCDGATVTDAMGTFCRGGDCACASGGCYLKCAKNLDCQNGYSCDGTKKLCVRSPCSTDAQCFSELGMARAKCRKGACGIPCTVDHDCSPSGDLMGQPFNGTVCGPDGVCAPVGCTSDSDCSASGGTRLFCVTPTTSTVHSAITN